jgi:signal transduction histidine kinase/DNA-binding winged helix-turn-helix (wHTH) protein
MVLLARTRALLRRVEEQAVQQMPVAEIVLGGLRISVASQEVWLDGENIQLTTQEFELLHMLARHAGTILSRDDIFHRLRGIDYDGLDRSIDGRISKLRRKLGDSATAPSRIKTVWGKGYLLVRQFLFRTYLVLVAGLLVTAALLDMGFGYLETKLSPEEDQWLATSFDLIEHELGTIPEDRRDAAAQRLSEEIGIGIQLLQTDDVVSTAASPPGTATLVDAAGNTSYLRDAPSLNGLIRLGPVAQQRESLLLSMLPPLFYLSIFVVVGLWLRPLLKDLNLITSAAQRFAADYREPLSTAGDATQLTGLARNLDDMSTRLSGLIRNQKELIAALSHEMRTPLARIRFALAVLANKREEDFQEQLDELSNDVQEIDQLIATMLNYARLDHPDLRMTWQDVPLEAWLTQTMEKCQQPGKYIAVETSESGDELWMDPRLMGLALSNLLVNAGHYAKENVRCTVRYSEGQYRIDVEDDGKGIPDAERESIFKAFTRIDDSRNRETGGYGLGLAIVARIATLHGGSVIAGQSDDLGGAMFTLSWAKPEN